MRAPTLIAVAACCVSLLQRSEAGRGNRGKYDDYDDRNYENHGSYSSSRYHGNEGNWGSNDGYPEQELETECPAPFTVTKTEHDTLTIVSTSYETTTQYVIKTEKQTQLDTTTQYDHITHTTTLYATQTELETYTKDKTVRDHKTSYIVEKKAAHSEPYHGLANKHSAR